MTALSSCVNFVCELFMDYKTCDAKLEIPVELATPSDIAAATVSLTPFTRFKRSGTEIYALTFPPKSSHRCSYTRNTGATCIILDFLTISASLPQF